MAYCYKFKLVTRDSIKLLDSITVESLIRNQSINIIIHSNAQSISMIEESNLRGGVRICGTCESSDSKIAGVTELE